MACAVEAVPRYTEADDDDAAWADEEFLPQDAHWDDECPGLPSSVAGVTLAEAVAELHRQAHGGPVELCQAGPCSRLELCQLREIPGLAGIVIIGRNAGA